METAAKTAFTVEGTAAEVSVLSGRVMQGNSQLPTTSDEAPQIVAQSYLMGR